MKASDVLREARNVLFERGWHQGSLRGQDGSVCALGAIITAGRCGEVASVDAHVALHEELAERVGMAVPVAWWNDRKCESFDELMDVFEAAEKRALIAEEAGE